MSGTSERVVGGSNLLVPEGPSYLKLGPRKSLNGSFVDLEMTGRFDADDFNGNLMVKTTNILDITIDESGHENVNQYQIMHKIGQGAFANVMKATYSTTGAFRLSQKDINSKKLFVSSDKAVSSLTEGD